MAAPVTAIIQHSDLQITQFDILILQAQIFNSVTELENWLTNNKIAVYEFDANKPVGNFNNFICSAFSNLLENTFLEITNKLKTKVPGGVPLTFAQLAEAGNFTIDVQFLDTTTLSQKIRNHTVSYSDMLTKFNVFKQAIDKAFDTTDIYISQSDFMHKFFNETLSLLNMNMKDARKLFESISATQQCEIANNIPWPGADEDTPYRFNTQFNWQTYCYICGNPITAAYPSQCEHIIPLMQACAFNCLIQKSTNMKTASAESKKLYKLEYAGAHKCCNILKRISFITIDINKNPPITINRKAIVKLLTEIRDRAAGQDDKDRLGCVNVLDFDIDTQLTNIITNYLQPIVDLLNAKLTAPTGTNYSASGLILLYIRINQFLSFQPSIQQTILSILTGSVKTEMLYIKVLTSAPFKIRTKLEKEIIDELKNPLSSDSHHLSDIGFTESEIDELYTYFVSIATITGRNGATSFIDLFNWIQKFRDYPDIKPNKKAFQSYNYFFNINHPSNSFDNSHFTLIKNTPTTASSPLANKIKYFFKSLIEMFYSEKQQVISTKEEDALSDLCKKYIGMEFTYIISYYLYNTNWPKLEELKIKLQTCHAKYTESYIKFVTHFFIYQLLHILYLLDYIKANITQDIIRTRNLVGETFFKLYDFLYTINEGKVLIDDFITKAIETLEPLQTELQDGVPELPEITALVTPREPHFLRLFTNLLNPLNIDIIVVKNSNISKELTTLFERLDSIPTIPLTRGGMRPEKRSKMDPEKKSKIEGKIAEEGEWRRRENEIEKNPYISKINIEIKRAILKLSTFAETTYSYYLRQHPTPLFQINLDKNISRLVINETRRIYICIYSPAYISSIYICILIDTYFLNKIVEMIDNKYVFSNGKFLDGNDIELLKELIHIQEDRVIGTVLYDELFNNSKFFTQHSNYIPLFEKCNLFLYYDSGDNSVRDIYDNKLYASRGGTILGGKKYHIKKTKKLKNKKIVKKTKEKLKTKSRKHKPRKHKSRKHKSKLTKTLKKKI
jgi:hypothetical protein